MAIIDQVTEHLRGNEPNRPEAFKVLNGLSMNELLTTLEELRKRGLLGILMINFEQSTRGLNPPRLLVAVKAVELKGTMTATDFEAKYASELATLPTDQRDEVRVYFYRRETARYSMSAAGLNLLFKRIEGFESALYNDQSGNCTIGFGFLVHRGRCDGTESDEFKNGITRDRGRQLSLSRLRGFENHLNGVVRVELTQWQVDALICFIFNAGALHELLEPINKAQFESIPQLLLTTRINGGKLIPRRRIEADLFSKQIYNP